MDEICKQIRRMTLECIGSIGSGHIGGSMSIVELLRVLYFDKMNVDPKNPKMEGRDRLIVSKGHAGPAVYATLALKGFFPKEWLYTLNRFGTNLPSHCDMNKTPGIDMTAGSLGQGLSAAVGMALAAKMDGNPATIYCFIGDGEAQEGQIWEATMLAGNRGLDNLIVLLDNNKLQLDGRTDDINSLAPAVDKWKAFGFFTQEVDGHDIEAISDAIDNAKAQKGKASMIVLNTIKGYGASFTEGLANCHSMSIPEELWRKETGRYE